MILLAQVPALLGLDTGTVRFVALGASADDEDEARGALQTALLLASASSAALMAILVWTAPWLADQFFHKPGATHLIRDRRALAARARARPRGDRRASRGSG